MKIRIALSLLVTLMCLGLASIPLMASTIWTTGGPEVPSPVGFAPFGPPSGTNPIPSVSFECQSAAGCLVQGISFWDFSTNGLPYKPTMLDTVFVGTTPYTDNLAAFSAPLTQTSCFSGATTWCNEFIDVHGLGLDFKIPDGVSYLTLYSEQVDQPTAWSNAAGLGDPSITLSQDPRSGVITSYPSPLAFSVFGQVGQGTTPEPSSILLLGSGILGLAGVLRRRVMR
jgi:PEP-CTERM motif